MFGVVPRILWERESPPDETAPHQSRHQLHRRPHARFARPDRHRLRQQVADEISPAPCARRRRATREKPRRRRYQPKRLRLGNSDHLHFDHAGGAHVPRRRRPTPTHVPLALGISIQRTEWEDANGNIPELSPGPTIPTTSPPLPRQPAWCSLIDGECRSRPRASATQVTNGHTRGHQIIHIQSRGESAVCLADLLSNVPLTYDRFGQWRTTEYPLTVRHTKPIILNEMVDQHRIALFFPRSANHRGRTFAPIRQRVARDANK